MDSGAVTAAPQNPGYVNGGQGACNFVTAEGAYGGLFQIRRQIRMSDGVCGHGRTVASAGPKTAVRREIACRATSGLADAWQSSEN